MEEEPIEKPLTDVQLELLKTFAQEFVDADLMDVKRVLDEFFAEELIQNADGEEELPSDEKLEKLLKTKFRKDLK